MSNVIAVLTGKNLNSVKEDGGSGHWIAKSERIENADYVLLVRNHRETWSDKESAEHGQAFMIGKISGCIPSDKHDGRKLIQISEYSLLPDTDNFKKAWTKLTKGQRYPVAYLNDNDLLTELNLDINKLEWIKFESNNKSPVTDFKIDESKDLSTIISEAKEMIAHAAGVETDKVDIQIKF
ncbi:hypothetical protein RZ964_002525 [Acinetobacter baumannii]|uniref:hypothetical protein n=1 Tax=Acinetobacter calcoaceticus/baumannii complex TaxID=909768 RepID=UPI0009BFC308|nr:hypothetical protein [Acinetobacter lactucae]ELN8903580.1 hypothetical protein [Acinetobacter baumannii]ARD27811.1 hypothetical protein OTEC02_02835 [Acinetobacter lactucae]ELT0787968.1 hypothetical protein [Acinetobacter baumannii]MDC4769974.1 hypothetical protein [Acinetobacter baumannii]MDV7434217.1 hypothetical protein [Acinetobacter baumannii]